MRREHIKDYILEALTDLNGSAPIWEICKHVWINHLQNEITEKDKDYYIWQYEIRWAADILRHNNQIISKPRGNWTLTKK